MALIEAVLKDNIGIVRLLLEYGANPLIEDNEGYNSFHYSGDLDEPDISDLLLEYE